MKKALISVSDKTGIIDLARALYEAGVEILSTGGTARLLIQAHIPVMEVASYTGFPEMLEGRLKTLHPRVHGGLLGRPDRPDDRAAMQNAGIDTIDFLVVNLYPFERTSRDPRASFAEVVEQIDIGGPAMLRSAAKNHAHVLPVVDCADYAIVIEALKNPACLTPELRRRMAAKVFAHTSRYDGLIARYLEGGTDAAESLPEVLNLTFVKRFAMRYGENPHQRAAFYEAPDASPASIAQATKIQGKELSFNNVADADAALECVRAFAEPACVIVKHANPCGAALGETLATAYDRAYATDPTSAFGGIIAVNRPLDEATAALIVGRQFVEVIVAPEVSAEAARILGTKPGIRVLVVNMTEPTHTGLDYRRVSGGLLVQDRDTPEAKITLEPVSRRRPTPAETRDLVFAWRIAQFVKSNAIVFARDGRTIGIGAGQMSRVDSARVAVWKAEEAGLDVKGSVLASDAFFPFRDGLDSAAEAGVTAVIQPGGSVRDTEVIASACEHDIAMVFTGRRHFRHA
ncbi:bifunctional phosphoribosylaminoimidazolecarboxamide formyltransferase/IMP cyclohydrolase [Acidiferrobacter sp.]|jgi:phosphoribosylaminoimidazolecarboxamide formyltransferase/IMP cyclohydrolase|uniref:bifunctional phosphoribosylaminoimidazolecarboxamide formyltransferase/IMP cyclohydrolase n=1 Tax=Acidiferrobacter sp. TaxID=1872107 RepID=UPI00262282EB|nr:bifunctional phosphoribosylaminoimidazolecarboxamide formyltransferase/IMP cyclohydrolase [Acidiferrobacter sp.]